MVIPHEIIPVASSSGWMNRYYNNTGISQEMICLLIITHFHLQGKINDMKRNAMFKSLKAGTLLRKIGTHHCTVNDVWYNDEGMFNILCDAYYDVCQRRDLTIEQFLPYLNLYHNKNRNYCLNAIYHDFVKPLLQNFGSQDNVKLLRKFCMKDLEDCMLTYEEADRKYSLGSGYCCSDCDGCYSRYKQSRYESNYARHDKKKASELFINYLNNLKTGKWHLAPFQLTPEL